MDKVKLEYEVGPLKINFRILLEPKGFLRIIILFVALLAFSLTAGFNSTGTSNTVTCTSTNNSQNYTAYLAFNYPYDFNSYVVNLQGADNFTNNNSLCTSLQRAASTLPVSGSAQFFVAMGILTIIYVVGAILVYMLFITPELFMAKWLVIGDFIATIIFGVIYVLASIAWSAGAAQLNTYLAELLQNYAVGCFQCDNSVNPFSPRTQPFTQAAVAAIFGWLASFIWFASIWFVYKDTTWHKDEAGPLAQLYAITKPKKDGENGEQSKDDGGEEGAN